MTPYLVHLAIVVLAGLIPSAWFLILFRPSRRVDLALSWVIFGLVGVIFLLYLRSGLTLLFGFSRPVPSTGTQVIIFGLGWLCDLLLWTLLHQFLRRRGPRRQSTFSTMVEGSRESKDPPEEGS